MTDGELCALGARTQCSEEGPAREGRWASLRAASLATPPHRSSAASLHAHVLAQQHLSGVQERPPWLPRSKYTSTSISSCPPSLPNPMPMSMSMRAYTLLPYRSASPQSLAPLRVAAAHPFFLLQAASFLEPQPLLSQLCKAVC